MCNDDEDVQKDEMPLFVRIPVAFLILLIGGTFVYESFESHPFYSSLGAILVICSFLAALFGGGSEAAFRNDTGSDNDIYPKNSSNLADDTEVDRKWGSPNYDGDKRTDYPHGSS